MPAGAELRGRGRAFRPGVDDEVPDHLAEQPRRAIGTTGDGEDRCDPAAYAHGAAQGDQGRKSGTSGAMRFQLAPPRRDRLSGRMTPSYEAEGEGQLASDPAGRPRGVQRRGRRPRGRFGDPLRRQADGLLRIPDAVTSFMCAPDPSVQPAP